MWLNGCVIMRIRVFREKGVREYYMKNFNLEDNKMLSLGDVLNSYGLDRNEVQNKINNDIYTEQKKSDDLRNLGYNVFSRDINSEIYNVQNIEEYFIYNNNIYIIFAYGNNKITSEMDIVII